MQVRVGVVDEARGVDLVDVRDDHRTAVLRGLQRVGTRADDEVAREDRVGLLRVDADLVQALRHVGHAHVRQHHAALLREPHEVEHRRALVLEVRGHRDQRTDSDHARPADAGHEQIVRRVPAMRRGKRKRVDRGMQPLGEIRRVSARASGRAGRDRQAALAAVAFERVRGVAGFPDGFLGLPDALAYRATVHGHEARTEAVDARIVLVARRLFDHPLAAELRLERNDRQAVRLHAAVPAAFAHRCVDEEALRRVRVQILLATASLLGRAGLVVDQDRHAFDLAQFALHAVEVVAMVEGRAVREAMPRFVMPIGVVADDDDTTRTFGVDLARDREHADLSVDRLPAGHRDRVVEQDLVGDVRLRRDRLTNREIPRVVVGPVAEVLEDVRRRGEHRVRDPVDTLAAHLDQSRRRTIRHPRRHEVTADAGLRVRALGHLRRRVVRTTGAEVRHAPHRVALVRQQRRREEIHDARATIERGAMAREPGRDDRHHARRSQLADRRQQR